MRAGLQISSDLVLPLEAVTQAIGILAKRRAGKSYSAAKFTEQLSGAGQQVVIVDLGGVASVVGLFLRRGPSAILRRVWTVVVDAVDGVLRAWAWPHVAIKGREVMAPFFADEDSPPAPVGMVRRARIVATILDALPRVELGSLAHTVCAIGRRCPFSLEATARLNLLPQVVLSNDGRVAAVATTYPQTMTRARTRGLFDDYQSAESLSREVGAARKHAPILATNGQLVGSW